MGFICNECLFNAKFIFYICSGGIYNITLKSLVLILESIFYLVISTYTFVFLYNFSYI